MVPFPPPFYFVFYISNFLSYIENNFSYELARPIMGTIFLVINQMQGLYVIYKSRDMRTNPETRGGIPRLEGESRDTRASPETRGRIPRHARAKPEWQGFMIRVQTERWFITIL